MAALDTVTARRLARSILEARKEGRTLRPLTNTHLLNRSDALRIQDALLDLRIGQGEVLVGWYLEKSGELAPLTDRMYFPAQPIGLVDAQQIEVVAIYEDTVARAVLIIDRVIKGALPEDFLAHGCGLVGIIMGEPIASDGSLDGESVREEVAKALKLRKRDLHPTDLVIRAVR
jgi:hypothetical protein